MEINKSDNHGSRYTGRGNAQEEDPVTRRLYPGCVLICFYLCVLATFTFDSSRRTSFIRPAVIILVTLVAIGVYWFCQKKLSADRVILLIFAASFIVKLCYVLYVTISENGADLQHDFYVENGYGHADYIRWFYENGLKLSDQNPAEMGQFYHPPLHHILAALWAHMQTFTGLSYERALAGIQFLTLFYSCSCTFVAERIFRKIGLKRFGLIVATAIIAFHPTFIILAGSLNNDILSILFIFLAIYATICWYYNPSTKNIIWIALSVGFGMMTKLSVAVVAPPIALVFLVKWIREKKIWKQYLKQYCLFGIICVPLGIWYSVRNFVKFGVPFGYVPRLSEASTQYVGNHSLFERLFDFSNHPFHNVFVNWTLGDSEYNIIVDLLKTSLFGEFDLGSYFSPKIIPLCRIALVINVVLIAIALFATVFFLIKKNRFLDGVMKWFLGGYYVLLMAQYLVFCVQYPHTCSMDFRYIVPTLLIGSLFIGILLEYRSSRPMKQRK